MDLAPIQHCSDITKLVPVWQVIGVGGVGGERDEKFDVMQESGVGGRDGMASYYNPTPYNSK